MRLIKIVLIPYQRLNKYSCQYMDNVKHHVDNLKVYKNKTIFILYFELMFLI